MAKIPFDSLRSKIAWKVLEIATYKPSYVLHRVERLLERVGDRGARFLWRHISSESRDSGDTA